MRQKIYFLGLSLLLSANYGFCQTLKLDDLLKTVKCRDKDCFSAQVSALGFAFDKQMEVDSERRYIFVANSTSVGTSEHPTSDDCFLAITNKGKIKSAIETNDQDRYKGFLDELKLNGFENTGMKNIEYTFTKVSWMEVNYKSKKYPKLNLILYSYPKTKRNKYLYRFSMEEV